jgi:hypothetical protein
LIWLRTKRDRLSQPHGINCSDHRAVPIQRAMPLPMLQRQSFFTND